MQKHNTGSIFDHWHSNQPKPFNPDFIPYARDVQTLAVYYCHLAGVYRLRQCERPALIRREYDRLMLLGKPSAIDVRKALNYLADC